MKNIYAPQGLAIPLLLKHDKQLKAPQSVTYAPLPLKL